MVTIFIHTQIEKFGGGLVSVTGRFAAFIRPLFWSTLTLPLKGDS